MRLGQPVMVGLRYEGDRAHGALGLLLPCSGNGILLKQWVCIQAESRCRARQVSVGLRGEVTLMEFQQTWPSSRALSSSTSALCHLLVHELGKATTLAKIQGRQFFLPDFRFLLCKFKAGLGFLILALTPPFVIKKT